MKIFKSLIIASAILLSLSTGNSFAQGQSKKNIPELGKQVPFFQLKEVGNFKSSTIVSGSLKGKHVIIDFWNKACISCVQSFPKLNKLHAQYGQKLDLILVGDNGGAENKGIEEMFENFKKKGNLKFPYAFNAAMFDAFVPYSVPHIMWIDDKGVIQAISSGQDLTSENIEAFLQGKPFSFRDKSHAAVEKDRENAYDGKVPFMFNGNGGGEAYEAQLRYRSVITEYIPGLPKTDWPDVRFRSGGTIGLPIEGNRVLFETCTSLEELYRTAYTGWVMWDYSKSEIYNTTQGQVILELSDSSLFQRDSKTEMGFYWYSLLMPAEKNSPAYVMESMQNDLYRYFGYHARMETRTFPYLKLVATEKAKGLKSKGGKQDVKADRISFRAVNIPLKNFFNYSLRNVDYWEAGGRIPVIIDETGMTDNIDLDIKINIVDWTDIQRVYKELGFEFVPGEKEFKVLVISDKPKS